MGNVPLVVNVSLFGLVVVISSVVKSVASGDDDVDCGDEVNVMSSIATASSISVPQYA